MLRYGFALMFAVLLVGGCASPEPLPPPSKPLPERPVELPPPEPVVEPRQDKLKHLANRKLKPMPDRPLNAKASCSFRDPTGYRGRLSLDVKEAAVKRFEANVAVPKQGNCSFKLADFRQIDTLPMVVLEAKRGECKVRFWEQDHQVTVAFRDCRTECSGNSVDYLWPILVDNRKGSCS